MLRMGVKMVVALGVMFGAACSRGDAPANSTNSAVSSIEGDVYVTTPSGESKRGTGRVVALVRNTDSARIRAAHACETYEADIRLLVAHAKAINDTIRRIPQSATLLVRHLNSLSAAMNSAAALARSGVNAALLQDIVDTVGTDSNAHYRFSGVKPGRYLLVSDLPTTERHYAWLVPIDATPGQAMHRDLDGSVENGTQLYCGAK